ncbi:hypothetical protein M1247_23895 [Mycobacterium sp. 21AC1]|uniref:hypothetical protein n=1 Tax=[Mycobacterium] appelbergii TaxID=2939269 RepID=UPI0029391FE9|nr:hypothetical protein [Mycobacterium sp. 21AC1]MDV3127980.1 hypothetical protein [Mycobacterium sp. 21AC1]
MTVSLVAAACGSTNSAAETTEATTTTTAPSTTSQAAAAPVDSGQLQSLIPTPANSEATGPDTIPNNGVHLHYKVNAAPNDAMQAYKAALTDKGWAVTTIVSSGGGEGGGGATFTGTHGEAYGVFDGGGFASTTFIDVCAWPTKPADPNCSRGER